MPMSNTYLEKIATAGVSGAPALTKIGLVNAAGEELNGGSPAYARQSVTWVADGDGIRRPNAAIDFDIPPGANVAGWRAYTEAGVDYGGADLTQENFTNQGTYKLLAAGTGIVHQVPA